jgi:predicted site-specific integrase-resolvase
MTQEKGEFMKASEVAKEFDVSLRTVNRWIKSGYFPGSIRRNPRAYNSTYIVPKEAVEKFKKERASTVTEAS